MELYDRHPAMDRHKPGFDDSAWKKGPGGFGDFPPTFPTLIVPPRTKWTSSDVWIRRTFQTIGSPDAYEYLDIIPSNCVGEVYLNGYKLADIR